MARRRMKSGYRRGAKLMSAFAVVGSVTPVVGVDLGGTISLATMLSPMDGSLVQETFSFSMDDEGYLLFSRKVPANARIAFEATSMAYPFSRMLRTLGYSDITAAHATELAWIVRSKKKNDRADSLKIARLHMAGMIPESYVPDRDVREVRDLVRRRRYMVGLRTMLKNKVTLR
jgi:transposase